ncbi:MAG TPA: PspC domain-containing protein [Candidatus Limnocylindrales bacterium]
MPAASRSDWEGHAVAKRLYRSRTDRMLFGVAGGFAEYLDLDPAVVRIVWAFLVLAAGAGFLLYIVAAIVIPEEPYPGAARADAAGMGVPTGANGQPLTDAGAPGAAPGGMPGWSAGQPHHRDSSGAVVFGGILVLIGLWFFAKDLIPAFDDRLVVPGVLVVVGLVLVLGSMRRR